MDRRIKSGDDEVAFDKTKGRHLPASTFAEFDLLENSGPIRSHPGGLGG
jgi:hypothetical protein